MVRSDLAGSGVIFTIHTETGFEDVVLVTGSYGIGENIVRGTVDPDEFYVFKPTYRTGHPAVLRRRLGSKEFRMVLGDKTTATRNLATGQTERRKFCISDAEVLALTGHAIAIEDHYSSKAGRHCPMDIEWAKDGLDGNLYIVQARPETVASRKDRNNYEQYRLRDHRQPIVTGQAVGTKISSGKARIITKPEELSSFLPGEVLVADTTSPDWGTVMKSASAIVTNRGGRTCHAAIVARELGIPAIVGTETATILIQPGETVTVNCAEGNIGEVYSGAIAFDIERIELKDIPRPRTHILLNIGNPNTAFRLAALPNDGVGLARLEFIIAQSIKAHPMALLHPERIQQQCERESIAALTIDYRSGAEFFVQRLSEAVGTIAAAFYPKPVIVRMSDFKSNEYASLLGGAAFEPKEANPMIGFRGASRYTHPAYCEGFALECAAMRRVRAEMGLTNVRLMIPFCRQVKEAEAVVRAMAEYGLERGRDDLEIYLMCEIPNNVLLVDQFSKHFDGFSIGSNDLTQLTLGVDRNSEMVAFDFDERDEGVMKMIELAIRGAQQNGKHCGICGQAPSDYPEFAEHLIALGIESISLNPDAIVPTTRRVLALEKANAQSPSK